MLSGGYNTMLSVPNIITRATPQSMGLCYAEKSIVTIFKEAGFKTFWLGSLTSLGTPAIDVHSKEADKLVYMKGSEGNGEGMDEGFIDLLEEELTNGTENKLFFVIHTAGSHLIYQDRYPETFDHFKPSGKGQKNSIFNSNPEEHFINSYDNTILYTDFVLDKIFEVIENQAAVSWAWYISDHGEHLFDGEYGLLFHTRPDKITLHVPSFLWVSKEYQEVYPEKYGNLLCNYSKAHSSNDMFFSLGDFANISFPGAVPQKSMSSPQFEVQARWYTGLDEFKRWD